MEFNSTSLSRFLRERNVWFRLHEYDEDVKTVARAGEKVNTKEVVKSLVFMDSNDEPFIIILPADRKVNFKKAKRVLGVKDVRLARPDEVLRYSGYPVGAVPPVFHKNIKRVILDSHAMRMGKVFAGGGDTNKLIEMRVEDIRRIDDPVIADISEAKR